jgi:DNA polymerase III epsilon subunit-like protein
MMMSLTGSSPKLSCTPPLRSSAIEEIQSLAGISNAMVRDAPTFRELPKEVQ